MIFNDEHLLHKPVIGYGFGKNSGFVLALTLRLSRMHSCCDNLTLLKTKKLSPVTLSSNIGSDTLF